MVYYHCFSDKHILCKNYIYHYNPPLGSITLASDGKSLTGLWLDGQKYFPYKLISESIETELPIFTQAINGLILILAARFLISLRQSVSKQLRSARQYMIYCLRYPTDKP